MKNLNLSKIANNPVMLASMLQASIRSFFIAEEKEILIQAISTIRIQDTKVYISTTTPLLRHELDLYREKLQAHLLESLKRV